MSADVPVACEREQFQYARPPVKATFAPAHIHAYESGRTYTLCGNSLTGEWEAISYAEFPDAKLCGTCDKAIRARIREAREAEALAALRAAGEGAARRLLEALLLDLARVEGALDRSRRELEHALSAVQAAGTAVAALVFDRAEADEQAHS